MLKSGLKECTAAVCWGPGYYSCVRRSNFSVAEFSAAFQGFFTHGGGGFDIQALGVFPVAVQAETPTRLRIVTRTGSFHGIAAVVVFPLVGVALARGISRITVRTLSMPFESSFLRAAAAKITTLITIVVAEESQKRLLQSQPNGITAEMMASPRPC